MLTTSFRYNIGIAVVGDFRYTGVTRGGTERCCPMVNIFVPPSLRL
jgi:hypothetical protein